MSDDPRAQLANLLSAELEAAQRRWAKAVLEFESLCASKGMFQSGARITGTAERLCEGLVGYRQFTFDKWTAYVRPRLPSLPAADQAAFVEVAIAAMDKAIADALGQFDDRPKPQSRAAMDFSGPIKETGARERQSLESELRLYISTPTTPPASMNVNVTTHGPGSPVNVGSGTQTQQINTAKGMGELVAALTTLLEAMKDHPHLGDVREIVVEAKDEATKPAPNKLKLRSILGGIKDGLQGVAALHPAWESVHRVMQMLGFAV
jgi:hypothetical protein